MYIDFKRKKKTVMYMRCTKNPEETQWVRQ